MGRYPHGGHAGAQDARICQEVMEYFGVAGMAQRDYRVFYAAGLDVRMHTYPATHRLHPDMLRDVNRWIMEICNC